MVKIYRVTNAYHRKGSVKDVVYNKQFLPYYNRFMQYILITMMHAKFLMHENHVAVELRKNMNKNFQINNILFTAWTVKSCSYLQFVAAISVNCLHQQFTYSSVAHNSVAYSSKKSKAYLYILDLSNKILYKISALWLIPDESYSQSNMTDELWVIIYDPVIDKD